MNNRELNAEVAVKVMNWHREHVDAQDGRGPFWNWLNADSVGQHECLGPNGWRPSDDIAAAMTILDKADGLWELSRYPEAISGDEEGFKTVYGCRLRLGDNFGASAGCASAAEAICRAALAASTTKAE